VFIDYLQEAIPELKDLNEAQVRRAIKYDAVDRLEVCYPLLVFVDFFFSQQRNHKGILAERVKDTNPNRSVSLSVCFDYDDKKNISCTQNTARCDDAGLLTRQRRSIGCCL
jgi:undecaprenyl pyrophosphate synthase